MPLPLNSWANMINDYVYGFKNKTLEAKPQNILLEVDKSLGILSLIRCWSSTKSILSPPHTHLTLTLCLQFVTELNYVSPLRSLVTWQPSPVGTVSSPTTLTTPDWFFPPTRFLPISQLGILSALSEAAWSRWLSFPLSIKATSFERCVIGIHQFFCCPHLPTPGSLHLFLKEFPVSVVLPSIACVITNEDFNSYINNPSNVLASLFSDILSSTDFVLYLIFVNYSHGHSLEFVIPINVALA